MRLAEWVQCCVEGHAACMYSRQHDIAMQCNQNIVLYVVLKTRCIPPHQICHDLEIYRLIVKREAFKLHHIHAMFLMYSNTWPLLSDAACATHETKSGPLSSRNAGLHFLRKEIAKVFQKFSGSAVRHRQQPAKHSQLLLLPHWAEHWVYLTGTCHLGMGT